LEIIDDKNVKNFNEKLVYTLPDGNNLKLGEEIFKIPELYFKPNLFEKNNSLGLHELCYNVKIKKFLNKK